MNNSLHTLLIILSIVIVIIVMVGIFYFCGQPRSIIVSMTTIPERVETGKLEKTIESLMQQSYPIKNIYIHIPQKTRNGKTYPMNKLNTLQEKYQFIQFNVIDRDYGPITKLLPICKKLEKDDWIVLVDDDVIYHRDMVRKLVETGKSAVGYAGRDEKLRYYIGNVGRRRVEFLETFAGVLYYGGVMDGFEDYYMNLGEKRDVCMNQDDIVIGRYLKEKGVERWLVGEEMSHIHDGSGTPELRNENLSGGNKKCYKTLFT